MNEMTDTQAPIERPRAQRIHTRCPSCHNSTLAVNESGHIFCTWLECNDPTLIHFMGEPPQLQKGFRLKIEADGYRQSDAAKFALQLIGNMLQEGHTRGHSCGGTYGNASGQWEKR